MEGVIPRDEPDSYEAEAFVPRDAPSGIYGPDGRAEFFQDPAMDRFVAVVLKLTSDLWCQEERIATLEALLDEKGIATAAERSALIARPDVGAARDALLKSFIARVLAPLREQ